MKVVFTEDALSDLDAIIDWLVDHYPQVKPDFDRRLRIALARIGHWPESAQHAARRAGVRVMTLSPYPYRVFYRVSETAVEILHVHHAAREPWGREMNALQAKTPP
jgi:toxin ParE1/3/4